MSLAKIAYAEAYQLKAELGGGFRGVALYSLTGEKFRGEVRQTIEQARNDAKVKVWEWADGRNMATGTFKGSRTNWKMNYFIRCDEVTQAEVAALNALEKISA